MEELSRPDPEPDRTVDGSVGDVNGSGLEAAEVSEGLDPLSERENLRAQSTVSMYRQPANHAPRFAHPIWRLPVSAAGSDTPSISGFESELHVMSRVLGVAFIALVLATIGLVGWQLATTTSEPVSVRSGAEEGAEARPQPVLPEPTRSAEGPAATEHQEHDYSGELRLGVNEALSVGPGQGVLELSGSPDVTVFVDGIDRGTLPVTLVLDQGRHLVRYTLGERRAVRFYFVEAGATRSLDVTTRPSGFVDAR